jgi:hypothetical protein
MMTSRTETPGRPGKIGLGIKWSLSTFLRKHHNFTGP